ncbi:MAG TPA: type II toxin-antitoxin system ParD family antitoxin [Allosphingosinicella sp.]|jgi:antitoxin ParD1/3/4
MNDLPALDPRDEAFIDEAVASGRYPSRAALISQGVQLVRQREDRLAAVKAAIERGIEDVRAGRVADLDAALARIETMLDEIEAVKRG